MKPTYEELKAKNEHLKDLLSFKSNIEILLKESEDKFQSMVESLPGTIISQDNNGIITFISPRIKGLTGFNTDKFLGKQIPEDLIFEDDRELFSRHFEKLNSGKKLPKIEYRIKKSDGVIIWVRHSTRPIKINDKIKGIQNYIRDITKEKQDQEERRIIEKELSYAQILMQAAFDQSPVPMVVAAYPDFAFKIINKATEDFLLLKASDYLNKKPVEVDWNWQEYLPDGTPVTSITELPLPLALQGITTINKEMTIERHDGSKVVELASAAPIYGKNGELLAGILAMVDITDRKKTEKVLLESEIKLKEQNEEYLSLNEELKEANLQLQSAKLKAEESDNLKTAFLQNISHEIRTPMNAIMGFSELLVNQYNNKEKLEQFSKIINQRCSDLLDIINGLLDVAKIESGLLPVQIEECKLLSLFSEISMFFKEFQKKQNKQHIEFNINMNCQGHSPQILTDIVKLKQILINLIGNAFKFTHKGKIDVGCMTDKENHILFFVSDSGIGIPKNKQESVFERFVQLEHSKEHLYGGTGLGLSIVKGLVDLLDGKIWLESEPNKGTTFYFTLPCAVKDVFQHEQVLTKKHGKYDFTNRTVLIVEDDIYNLDYLKEILADTGIKIIHTFYGNDAVHLSKTQKLDIVLMDIRLPDIDGYTATNLIRKLQPGLKIIAQTAYAAHEDKESAIIAGCNDYISKPVKRDILLSMINDLLFKS
jgi:PAS domain S-box-containing protein